MPGALPLTITSPAAGSIVTTLEETGRAMQLVAARNHIIGEGASGGALGIGIGDKVVMLENTWYTVISPENCSTILWRSWDYKVQAAEQLHLTSTDMSGFGLVDDVLQEPIGGAHSQPEIMAKTLKEYILKTLKELKKINPEKRVEQRIEKFSKMGFYEEL